MSKRLKIRYASCRHCKGSGRVIDWRTIRGLREQAGISLTDFARANKISPPHLSDVERGKKPVTLRVSRMYERLAEVGK